MSRKLDLSEFAASTPAPQERARSAGWAFAAAVSVLLIATLVVNRSSTAVANETAALVSESTLQIESLRDGQVRQHCIELVDGQNSLAELSVNVEFGQFTDPGLAASLVRGENHLPGSCDEFDSYSTIFDGTLQDFASAKLPVDEYETTKSLMFVVENQTGVRAESPGTIQFLWEVNPS